MAAAVRLVVYTELLDTLVRSSIPGHFCSVEDLSLKIFGDNKIAEFSDPNLAIFLLIFIKLMLLSLFFSHASTCSPLLTCNTPREGRANVQALPSSRGDPWETVKFESCGGARLFAPPHDSNFTVSQGSPRELGREPERLYLGPDPPSTLTANLH